MKLASFGHAVNVTLGLPFVRTSVDHGTGFDIVEKGSGRRRAACWHAHEGRASSWRGYRRGARAASRTAWRVSRSMSLRLIDSRLSWAFLPRARPISSLTRPFLK